MKPGDAHYRQFHKILEAFKLTEPEKKADVEQSPVELAAKSMEGRKKVVERREDSDDEVRGEGRGGRREGEGRGKRERGGEGEQREGRGGRRERGEGRGNRKRGGEAREGRANREKGGEG